MQYRLLVVVLLLNSLHQKMFFATVFLGLLATGSAQPAVVPQEPPIWDALDVLRGRILTVDEIQDLIASAIPGQSYPINAVAPGPGVDCEKVGLPGYFADDGPESRCQAFYRCDVNGQRKSFLCPNGTLFNQITLICDWFFNVDCQHSAQFNSYANSRLYVDGARLHDDQLVYNPAPGAPAPAAGLWNPSWNRAAAGTSSAKTNQRVVAGGWAQTQGAAVADSANNRALGANQNRVQSAAPLPGVNRLTIGAAQTQEEPADAAIAVEVEPANNRALGGLKKSGAPGLAVNRVAAAQTQEEPADAAVAVDSQPANRLAVDQGAAVETQQGADAAEAVDTEQPANNRALAGPPSPTQFKLAVGGGALNQDDAVDAVDAEPANNRALSGIRVPAQNRGQNGPPAPVANRQAGLQRVAVGGGAQNQDDSADAAVAVDAEPANNRALSGKKLGVQSGPPAPVANRLTGVQRVTVGGAAQNQDDAADAAVDAQPTNNRALTNQKTQAQARVQTGPSRGLVGRQPARKNK